jgi:multiple sugar transport system permease protein
LTQPLEFPTYSPPGRRRSRWRPGYWQRDAIEGVAFVSPQLAGFLLFVVGPVLAIGWFALHDWNVIFGTFDFVGTANFEAMLEDKSLPTVVMASVLFAVGYVPLNVCLGLLAALAVSKAAYAAGAMRTVYFVPVVVSGVAWAIVWRFMLQDEGAVNGFLSALGIEGPNWLRDSGWAIGMVVVVQVLKDIGFSMVIFLAALQGIPPELEEAARIDGANGRNVFLHVTLPLLTPFVFLSIVLSVISSIKSFALIFLLTRGGPGYDTTTIPFYIYQQGFQNFDMGYASSLAVVLFVVVMFLTAGQFAMRKRWVFYEE